MKPTIMFLFIVFGCFFGIRDVKAQLRLDILPMHSTCEDVSKILNLETCKEKHEVYEFKNELIIIDYSTQKCEMAYEIEWNVPVGTVLSVIRIPKPSFRFAMLNLDSSKCKVSQDLSESKGTLMYSCEQIGATILVQDDFVFEVRLTPKPEDSYLKCKQDCNER